MDKELSELSAAEAYAEAWNTLDCSVFVRLLASDSRYSSQYVFDELVGDEAIRDYLCGKFQAVCASGSAVEAVLSEATAGSPGKPCVLLNQDDNNAVVVFETDGQRVRRVDLCITQLYSPVPISHRA